MAFPTFLLVSVFVATWNTEDGLQFSGFQSKTSQPPPVHNPLTCARMSFIASLESSSFRPRILSNRRIRTWKRLHLLFQIPEDALQSKPILLPAFKTTNLQKGVTDTRNIVLRRIAWHNKVFQNANKLRYKLKRKDIKSWILDSITHGSIWRISHKEKPLCLASPQHI